VDSGAPIHGRSPASRLHYMTSSLKVYMPGIRPIEDSVTSARCMRLLLDADMFRDGWRGVAASL
jgi:hypothetical protein